ncbi:MAG: methyltransferase domain-containing protein [Halobacteriota archaeon]
MNEEEGRVIQQPIDAKKGEIEFRKKLYEQQVLGQDRLADELSTDEIVEIVRKRVTETYDQIKKLQDRGVVTSPYVEIGAERCQRSLVMENQLGSRGAAVDISFHSLQSCDFYRQDMRFELAPTRICCDAIKLPFASNSVPFVFCYDTLHHFPDPQPIIEEVHRVLTPGGCFFFGEEPFERKMHVRLYDVGKKYSKENRAKSTRREICDTLFGSASTNETEHGIIENESISLSAWKRLVNIFDKKSIVTRVPLLLEMDLFERRNYLKRFARYMLGGLVCGFCFKQGTAKDLETRIEDSFACPNCLANQTETRLIKEEDTFFCARCGERYPSLDGIAFLIPRKTLNILYPQIVDLADQ